MIMQSPIFLDFTYYFFPMTLYCLAESSEDLQNSLNAMLTYCDDWHLTINTDKTKVMILSRGKIWKKKIYLILKIIF